MWDWVGNLFENDVETPLTLFLFFVHWSLNNKQHMYDRALNFLLFKVVFVGAILEPRWEELLIWTAWFTILGFLRVFSMLCRDRFEYVRTTKRCLCKKTDRAL